MPQMNPMNWLIIMMMLFIQLYFLNSMMYFTKKK